MELPHWILMLNRSNLFLELNIDYQNLKTDYQNLKIDHQSLMSNYQNLKRSHEVDFQTTNATLSGT